jgi:hypothetical protein
MPDNSESGALAPHSSPPLAQQLDAELRSTNAGDETTADAVSSVQAARDQVRSAQVRLRHDISQVSQVGEIVVRNVWTKAKPILVIGAAIVGAVVVYRMLQPSHRGHYVRQWRRPDYDHGDHRERSSRIPNLVRSVAVSVAMAALNRWLRSVSEHNDAQRVDATAPDLHSPKAALD